MRITERQLRKIIRQERRRLHETRNNMMMMGVGGEAMAAALDKIRADWYDRWSREDPSMAPMGEDGWRAQVDAAVEALEEVILNEFEVTETSLINGDYARRLG